MVCDFVCLVYIRHLLSLFVVVVPYCHAGGDLVGRNDLGSACVMDTTGGTGPRPSYAPYPRTPPPPRLPKPKL